MSRVGNAKNKGYVYLLCNLSEDRVYKIGVTRGSIDKRIKKLQTGSSGEIMLVKKWETNIPFYIEGALHRKYGSNNVLNEWYCLSDDEVNKFHETCQEIENMAEALKDNPFFKYDKLK